MRGRGLAKVIVVLIMILIGYNAAQAVKLFNSSPYSSISISELDDNDDETGSVFV